MRPARLCSGSTATAIRSTPQRTFRVAPQRVVGRAEDTEFILFDHVPGNGHAVADARSFWASPPTPSFDASKPCRPATVASRPTTDESDRILRHREPDEVVSLETNYR